MIAGMILRALLPALIGILFIGLLIIIIITKSLKSIINSNTVTRVMGGTIIGIFVVIIGFTLMPFGIDTVAVVDGYNNTRTYAKDAKTIAVSVDRFKTEIENQQEDIKLRTEMKPSTTKDLGSYGMLLGDTAYEEYTTSLPSIPASYPEGSAGAVGCNWGTNKSDNDIPVAAKFGQEINFLSKSGKPDSNHLHQTGNATNNECRTLYGAGQCAGFGTWYANDVSYAGVTFEEAVNGYPGFKVAMMHTFTTNPGAVWWNSTNAGGPLCYQNKVEKVKEFFTNVTPGTVVRSGESKQAIHTYIILGADDNGLVIYDCNWCGSCAGGRCGIHLRHVTWDAFAANCCYVGSFYGIIAPPGTSLPVGCYSKEYRETPGCLSVPALQQFNEGGTSNE